MLSGAGRWDWRDGADHDLLLRLAYHDAVRLSSRGPRRHQTPGASLQVRAR